MKAWTLASGVALLLALGASACKPNTPDHKGETQTRSGELVGQSPPPPADAPPAPRGEAALETNDAGDRERGASSPTRDAGVAPRSQPPRTDPRFDAPRLSIVGSAKEREMNLGLVRDPTIGPVEIVLPAPQKGAGAAEPPPAPTRRVGAGRPGAGGATFQ